MNEKGRGTKMDKKKLIIRIFAGILLAMMIIPTGATLLMYLLNQ